MENRKHIGELYRNRRIEKGMTQGELAALSKVSLRSVQRIENGSVSARSYTLGVLAAQLDFEVPRHIEIPSQDRAAKPQQQQDRTRQVLLLVGLPILFALGGSAFLAQSAGFPETSFELLLYWTALAGICLAVLLRIFRK